MAAAYRRTLRAARKAKGWTQKQAAQAVGVSVKTWMSWEYGLKTPRLQHARRVAEIFNLPIEQLF